MLSCPLIPVTTANVSPSKAGLPTGPNVNRMAQHLKSASVPPRLATNCFVASLSRRWTEAFSYPCRYFTPPCPIQTVRADNGRSRVIYCLARRKKQSTVPPSRACRTAASTRATLAFTHSARRCLSQVPTSSALWGSSWNAPTHTPAKKKKTRSGITNEHSFVLQVGPALLTCALPPSLSPPPPSPSSSPTHPQWLS